MRLTHTRPAYGIKSVLVDGEEVAVTEEPALVAPFGTLLHFRKDAKAVQPKVLLAAPLSGHFATLLRETVRTLLRDHDVYMTDWHNARDVPLWNGGFGLDDYTRQIVSFLEAIGPGRPHGGGLPALRRGAGGHRADGRGRQPGHAAQPDADGRPGRLPHQSDRREQARHRAPDRLVRAQPDQPRAMAARRHDAPRVPGLPAAHAPS